MGKNGNGKKLFRINQKRSLELYYDKTEDTNTRLAVIFKRIKVELGRTYG